MLALAGLVVGAALLAGCGGGDDAAVSGSVTPAPGTPAPSAAATKAWVEDLEFLDQTVRATHPDPFWKNDEETWSARIAELRATLPRMTKEQARVAVAELVALLDTHSGVFPEEVGFHYYGIGLQEFSDGVFVVNATDPALIGSRLEAVGDTSVDDVLDAIEPLVNADNESALHGLRPWLTTCVEYLHTLGIVKDVRRPGFALVRPDGTTAVVDPPSLTIDDPYFAAAADDGVGPTARRRRGEPVWWRLDRPTSTFLLSYNEPGAAVDDALKAMKTALKDGSAKRVVLDMRYAGGGAWNFTFVLRDALATDPRLSEAGALTVLIGRWNVSASTALASWLDVNTNATLVGEPTPARPNPPLDETTFTLPNSGIPVHIPTNAAQITSADDDRVAVTPDDAVDLSVVDFFAGKDRALDVALGGSE